MKRSTIIFFVLIGIALLAITVSTGIFQPFLYDDAFISFRITSNILQQGKPFLFPSEQVYTSTSLLYPYLNLIPSVILGNGWSDQIPAWNSLMLVASMVICMIRASLSTGNQNPKHLLITFFLLSPWFLDFRTLTYANSGLETSWYMLAISLSILPYSPPWLSPWLILIRPEGWLAGCAVFLNSLRKKDLQKIRITGIHLILSLMTWILIGWLLFDAVVPQSLMAKSNHAVNRLNELAKGFSYLIFSGQILPFTVFLWSGYLKKYEPDESWLTIIWMLLYTGFFSVIAAWWPWYLPPLFIAFWYLSAEASLHLCSRFLNEPGFNPKLITTFGFLILVGGWQIKGNFYKISSASSAYKVRNKASANLGHYLQENIPGNESILLEPLGMLSWYGPELTILDYPGLSNPVMASYLSALSWKIPHRLTDIRTDSAILDNFKPDALVLWPEELAAFRQTEAFRKNYHLRKKLPYFPQEKRMDSVAIYSRLRN